MQVASK